MGGQDWDHVRLKSIEVHIVSHMSSENKLWLFSCLGFFRGIILISQLYRDYYYYY